MNMPLVLLNRRRRGFTAFSPSTLFSTTAIGVWLDPSDLATMFSDRAGTTPVTTPGTVVGLRLDKSKGLALGADTVVNGGFATNSDWALTTWTISGGKLNGSAVTGGSAEQSGAIATGKWYKVTMDVVCVTGVRLRIGRSFEIMAVLPVTNGTSATLTGYFLAKSAVFSVEADGAAFNGTIDNISVRELAGNHAVAPTDAARPTYGVEPKGGRRNLLTWSEDFTNAIWTKGGVSLSTGSSAASRIVTATSANGAIYQLVSVSPSAVVCNNSIEIRRITGTGAIQLKLPGNGGNPISVTSEWVRFSASGAAGGTINYFVVEIATSGDAIEIRYPQLELGSTATAYQKVTTAYDITESGVATCHYVQYDGSDDSMSTAAIDFTATDKMSVFAGVSFSTVATSGTIFETSSAGDINNGAFFLRQSSGGNQYQWVFKGVGSVALAVTYTPPENAVMTAISNLAAPLTTARRNGVQQAVQAGPTGGGNYGNYPLFIGRRNNTNLPFNGRDYGLIIVGKAASAGEITDTETWLAAKTAQVTL